MKVKIKSPSGKINLRYKRERTSPAKCANCKLHLHGVPRIVSSEMKKLSASERRPNRPYGGYLCSKCSREIFREKTRGV